MEKKIKNKYLLILILLPLILKLILAFIIPGHMTGATIEEYKLDPTKCGDLDIFRWITNALMEGKNPFSDEILRDGFTGYGFMFLMLSSINGITVKITGLPFHFVTKIFPILAETFISIVLFLILNKKYNLKKSFYWSLIFALNPASLAITTIHGQIDAIPILAVVLSYYFFMSNNRKIRIILPAVCLVIGASFKYFPVLLLPILFFKYKEIKEKLSFVVVTLASLFITYVPFMISGDFFTFIKGFSRVTKFNWGIAKFFLLLHRFNISSPYIALIENFLANYGKVFLALALLITVLVYSKVKSLERSYKIIFWCIYVFTFFMCTHFLTWIIPLLFIKIDLKNLRYLVLVTGHMYFLYVIELIGIGIGIKIGGNSLFQGISFIFGVLIWLYCIWMYFTYIKKDIKNIQFKRIFSIGYWLEQNKGY